MLNSKLMSFKSRLGLKSDHIWAILDQGLLAVSNLLVGIWIARWMGASDYGVFATGYAVFLLIGTLHGAAIIEPMSVIGPVEHRSDIAGYAGQLLKIQFLVSVLVSIGFCASAGIHGFLHFEPMSSVMFAFAIAAPAILTSWLLRRIFYITGEVSRAAWGGAIYLVVALAGLWAASRWDFLSLFSAIVIMGAAGAAGCVYYLSALRPRLDGGTDGLRRIWNSHSRYGRWSVGSNLCSWFSANLPYLLLPVFVSFAETGRFKALLNLILPMNHVHSSLGLVILPALSREAAGNPRSVRSKVNRMLVRLMVPTAAYCALLLLAAGWIYPLLYGTRYGGLPAGAWIIICSPLTAAAVVVYACALRALKRPEDVFGSNVISAGLSVILGIPLIFWFGTLGCSIVLVLVLAVSAWTLSRRLKLRLHQADPV